MEQDLEFHYYRGILLNLMNLSLYALQKRIKEYVCKSTVYLYQEFILYECFRSLIWKEIEYHCYKEEQKKIGKQKYSSKRNFHMYSAMTSLRDYLVSQ